MMTRRALAALYGLYGALAVLLLSVLMPPFQNPDEAAHMVRASQIAHGGWVARGGAAPALIDAGILEGAQRFRPLAEHVRPVVGRDLYVPLGWGGRVVAAYPNTAVYPPVFYLPEAAAIAVGQRIRLTVLPTLELARAATGIAAVLLGCVAIAVAGASALWIFAVLTLPMALAQTASVGQDGLMMASCALAAACLLRLQDATAPRRRTLLAVLCLALALVCQARPPYVAVALLPLAAGFPRAVRAAACALVLAAVTAWCVASLGASGIDVAHFNGSDAHAQAAQLLWRPWRLPLVLVRTLWASGMDYLAQFIGVLGALDVPMPRTYRLAAWLVLFWAVSACLVAGPGWIAKRRALLCAGCVAAAALGVFTMQYLTWSPPGSAMVDGVQGRYFLPLALLLGALLARPVKRQLGWVALPVLLFPIATIVVMVHEITLRYYF